MLRYPPAVYNIINDGNSDVEIVVDNMTCKIYENTMNTIVVYNNMKFTQVGGAPVAYRVGNNYGTVIGNVSLQD